MMETIWFGPQYCLIIFLLLTQAMDYLGDPRNTCNGSLIVDKSIHEMNVIKKCNVSGIITALLSITHDLVLR